MTSDGAATVDRQLAAFNLADADTLAATYAEDAEIVMMAGKSGRIAGRAAIRAHYAGMFETYPGLRAELVSRMSVGPIVTDHERVEPLSISGVAVYEVVDSLIRRAWLFGPYPDAQD